MKQLCVGLVLGAAIWGQQPAPLGVLRGKVVERDETATGDLSIRARDNHVFLLRYDDRTWAERDGRRVEIRELRAGDDIEVVADAGSRANDTYARRIRVLPADEAAPVRRPRARRLYRSPFDDMFPRGNLTFSGAVSELNPESLVLRNRNENPTRILLREDTRYLADGGQVAAGDLKVNQRVFVRAGKNLDGEIEAYQVVWGGILNPKQ